MIKLNDVKTLRKAMFINGEHKADTFVASVTVEAARHVSWSEIDGSPCQAEFAGSLKAELIEQLRREIYSDLPDLFAKLRSMAMCHVSPHAAPMLLDICNDIERKLNFKE